MVGTAKGVNKQTFITVLTRHFFFFAIRGSRKGSRYPYNNLMVTSKIKLKDTVPPWMISSFRADFVQTKAECTTKMEALRQVSSSVSFHRQTHR